jgi:hypothetical protein
MRVGGTVDGAFGATAVFGVADAAAAAAGAEIVEERPPSLEEVFLARRKNASVGSEQL